MDLDLVEEATIEAVRRGEKIFQIHRFASSDNRHVRRLLEWANFPFGSMVADLGCGVGEVARIMSEVRNDIDFTLINISKLQLDLAPDHFEKFQCSFLNVPVQDGYFDAAMFCFSIGHEDIMSGLKEAHRILNDSGVLFIYDMHRISGSNESMKEVEYEVISMEDFTELICKAGFNIDKVFEPKDDGSYGVRLLGSDFEKVFNGTLPVIWRLTKCQKQD